MSARTAFLSKLIGFYLVFTALAMILQKATTQAITGIVHDAPLIYFIGICTLVAGLAIILTHNVWSGGVLPVVVTLVGWILFAKGLLSMFLSPDAMVSMYDAAQFESHSAFYAAIMLVLGVYLTYSGFVSTGKTTS